MKPFKVREFRFLSKHDDYDADYETWSRPYEYMAVMKAVKPGFIGTIHNTASGVVENAIYPYNVSRLFADKLQLNFPKSVVYNTDCILIPDPQKARWYRENFNYYYFDLCTQWEGDLFDITLCISVIEHLNCKDQLKAVENLIDQTKSGAAAYSPSIIRV